MTSEEIATLPDDLLSAKDANDCGQFWNPALLALAAQRICDLEEEVLRLRCAVAAHRNANNFNGELRPSDGRLYSALGDLPWGNAINGDG